MSNNSTSSGGIGFFGALAIVFITLKIIGILEWSWWLVLMPLWIPIMIVLGFVIFSLILAIINTYKNK
jgi:hypothetical protein